MHVESFSPLDAEIHSQKSNEKFGNAVISLDFLSLEVFFCSANIFDTSESETHMQTIGFSRLICGLD